MVLVAFESSTRSPSVAALIDGELLEADLDGANAHASDLLPCLAQLLESRDRSPKDISAVAVGVGPGSYTGLRVGIATAQGVARAADASLVGIPSGEAIAHAELSPGERGDLIIDARGGALYHARFERTEGGVETLVAPRVVPADSLQALIDDSAVIFLDEALQRAVTTRGGQRIVTERAPRARALLELAVSRLEAGGHDDPSSVLPLYLRPFEGKIRKR
ncbi:MAG: tRNA (adenosine(37)-N6)-threonylcarbamoyltransferase complex dimerization subunit type 1 TsaB [Planctomycetes bacterium]|nr:tRNA (adenosine(37)-N6)-threonylcarbamoyltransferase complex dimerization subunit type 1 TsaB [Planctomycetota bacterium]